MGFCCGVGDGATLGGPAVNILCDFHHSDLWWSNYLTFEVALGHKLYCPRGMGWFEKGYYQQRHPDVAKQFLVHAMFTLEEAQAKFPRISLKKPPGNTFQYRASMDTIVGGRHFPLLRTLSFEEFASTKIDVIMATTADMLKPWAALRRDLKPAAKLVREEGNVNGWSVSHPDYKNVITSDFPTYQKIEAPNKLLYHQRFDTENVFKFRSPAYSDRISCFMPGFRSHPDLVKFTEAHDFGRMEFVDYGHHSKHGFLSPKEKYIEAMYRTAFVWHVKPGGDGFGHVLHNSLAMGRPIITIPDDYYNSLAWPLLLDGKTCILIGKNPSENSRKIKEFSNPKTITEMSEAAAERFRKVVDYQWETEQIKAFLWRLL